MPKPAKPSIIYDLLKGAAQLVEEKPPEWRDYRIHESMKEVHAYMDTLSLEDGERVSITPLGTVRMGKEVLTFQRPHFLTAISVTKPINATIAKLSAKESH